MWRLSHQAHLLLENSSRMIGFLELTTSIVVKHHCGWSLKLFDRACRLRMFWYAGPDVPGMKLDRQARKLPSGYILLDLLLVSSLFFLSCANRKPNLLGCHGLSLKMGVYINRISEGSLAAKDKSLTVGDRVIRINDKSMDDIESVREAMQVLNDENIDVINITTLKMSYPECPNVFTPVRRNKKENRSSQVCFVVIMVQY